MKTKLLSVERHVKVWRPLFYLLYLGEISVEILSTYKDFLGMSGTPPNMLCVIEQAPISKEKDTVWKI